MGYIHCCAGLRKAKSYSLKPEEDYYLAQVDYMECCPICGHTIVQLTRIDFKNNVSVCRKNNEKARRFFESLKQHVLYEKHSDERISQNNSKFYLNYNEYGTIKRCYSNLSTLKMGLFENKDFCKVLELSK